MDSVSGFLSALQEPRKAECLFLHNLFQELVPEFEPYMQSGMIGYGKQQYVGVSGRSGEWFHFGIGSGKTAISVYVVPYKKGDPAAIDVKGQIGKASVGISCIRFKKLADIDLEVLKNLIVRARIAKLETML